MLLTVAGLVLAILILLMFTSRDALAPYLFGLDLTAEDAHTVRVNQVDAGSIGGAMGLQSGDRILAVNGSPALSPWVVRNAILSGTPTVLYIGRGEQRLRSEITFASTDDLTPTVIALRVSPLV